MNGVSEDKMIDMVKKEWNQLIFVIFAIFAFFDCTNSDVIKYMWWSEPKFLFSMKVQLLKKLYQLG